MSSENVCEAKNNRVMYLDYLRVFAALAVMFIHISAEHWYDTDVDSLAWFSFNFYDCLVRWCVPIFIMISGALFLCRNDIPVKKIYSKYVLRLTTAYFAWSFIYFLFDGDSIAGQFAALFGSEKTEAVIAIMRGHFHQWFVTMIIGIYMCLPIIRHITKNEEVTKYYLLLSFIFYSLIPFTATVVHDFGGKDFAALIDALYSMLKGLRLELVLTYVFYFILGWQISKAELSKKSRMIIYTLGILGAVFTIYANYTVSITNQKALETYLDYRRINITAQTAAIFVFFKYTDFSDGKIYKIFSKLSKWSFGAYLVHALIMEQFAKCGFDTLSLPPFVSVPVIAAAVFVCSFAVSGALHCVPVLKKYIV